MVIINPQKQYLCKENNMESIVEQLDDAFPEYTFGFVLEGKYRHLRVNAKETKIKWLDSKDLPIDNSAPTVSEKDHNKLLEKIKDKVRGEMKSWPQLF